jgi:hypothetical protein
VEGRVPLQALVQDAQQRIDAGRVLPAQQLLVVQLLKRVALKYERADTKYNHYSVYSCMSGHGVKQVPDS